MKLLVHLLWCLQLSAMLAAGPLPLMAAGIMVSSEEEHSNSQAELARVPLSQARQRDRVVSGAGRRSSSPVGIAKVRAATSRQFSPHTLGHRLASGQGAPLRR